jgi:hypothetical protein
MSRRKYDSMPQSEDIGENGYPRLMSLEDVVTGSLRNEVNCLEWLGYDIDRRSPRVVPHGYRYDVRNGVYVPHGYAYCRRCRKVKAVTDFGTDKRNKGREHTRSFCSTCEAIAQTPRNRKQKARKLSSWRRG